MYKFISKSEEDTINFANDFAKNLKVGDIITIIGEDNNITAEQVADKADTITNELLCRLGDRLARIIVWFFGKNL